MGEGDPLLDEFHRAMKGRYNYVEPTIRAKVTAQNSNDRFTVHITELGEDYPNVPVLKPCYKEEAVITCDNTYCTLHVTMNQVLDVAVGDYVLVAFKRGQFSSPVIVGKF